MNDRFQLFTELLKNRSSDHYSGEQVLSRSIDRDMGFNVEIIEEMLISQANSISTSTNQRTMGPLIHDGHQTWVGLNVDQLQTPYQELELLLVHLKLAPETRVCDLGAGYGRLGLVMRAKLLEGEFVGYEYVEERVCEGNRIFLDFGLNKIRLIKQDISDVNFMLPDCDVFFIYDFGHKEQMQMVLEKLRILAKRKTITVVARGRGIRSLIQAKEAWLTQVTGPQHFERYSIYTTA